jgi:hypothetical protein
VVGATKRREGEKGGEMGREGDHGGRRFGRIVRRDQAGTAI